MARGILINIKIGFSQIIYLFISSNSSIVFFAFAKRIALFFSIILSFIQCSSLWCNGISKDAKATKHNNIKIGEWWVTSSRKGWISKLINSNTINKPKIPKKEIHFSLTIILRLKSKNRIRKLIMPKAIKAYWRLFFRSFSIFAFSVWISRWRNCSAKF